MKKLITITLILFLFAFASNAQKSDSTFTSKNGVHILPQRGDWALAIDARPFTRIFNFDSDAGFQFPTDNTFIGKKFIKPDLAHRFKLRLAFNSNTDDEFIMQDGQVTPDPTVVVKDVMQDNQTVVMVGYGIEKRSGYMRLQALYGGEVLISYDDRSTSYEYGNHYSMENPVPTTTYFGNNIPDYGYRVVFTEYGYSLSVMARAFLGIEFFFAPKIAIGGEFGWGVAYTMNAEGKQKVSSWDDEANNVKYQIIKTGGGSSFGFDNDNFGGLIYLIFHFR